MRIPTVRFKGDDAPIARWEWLFYPLVFLAMLAFLCVLAVAEIAFVPYFLLYPERCLCEYDWGTEREREVARRYREFTSRVPFWARLRRAFAPTYWKRHARTPRRTLREARRAGDAPGGRAE